MRNKLKKSVLSIGMAAAAFLVVIGISACDGNPSSTLPTSSSPVSSSTGTSSSTVGPSSSTVETFTVTFVNSEVSDPKVFSVVDGETVKAQYQADSTLTNPTPAIEGHEAYEFDGWYIGDNKYDFDTPVTSSITLNAKWIEKYYVIYENQEGVEQSREKVVSGETATKPADLVSDQREFAGWYTDTGIFDFTTPITSSVTLTGKFYYVVTFDYNGGTGETSATVKVPYGETVSEPTTDPTLDHHSFGGWYVGSSAYRFASPVIADLTLKARWNYQLEGEGTLETPFIIATEQDLRGFASLVNDAVVSDEGVSYVTAFYNLTADIVLSDEPFTPIVGFSGIFNGNGHSITNVHIAVPGIGSEVGFFASTDYAVISRLNLKVYITAEVKANGSLIGGLVGSANETQIVGCTVGGSIELNPKYNDRATIGGLVGQGSNVKIDTCVVSFASVDAEGRYDGVEAIAGGNVTGGIAGSLKGADTLVSSVYADTLVLIYRSGTFAGLVADLSEGAKVVYCFANSNIFTTKYCDANANSGAYYLGVGEGFYGCLYLTEATSVANMPWNPNNWDFSGPVPAIIGVDDTRQVTISIYDFNAEGALAKIKDVTIPYGTVLASVDHTPENKVPGYIADGSYFISGLATDLDLEMPLYGDISIYPNYYDYTDLVSFAWYASGKESFVFDPATSNAVLKYLVANNETTANLTLSNIAVEAINHYVAEDGLSIGETTYKTPVFYMTDGTSNFRIYIQHMLDGDFEKGILFIQKGNEGNWSLISNRIFFCYTSFATGAYTEAGTGDQYIFTVPYAANSTVYYDAYGIDGTAYMYSPYIFYGVINSWDLGFTLMDADGYYVSEYFIIGRNQIAKFFDYATNKLALVNYTSAVEIFADNVWYGEDEALWQVATDARNDTITDYKYYQYKDLVYELAYDAQTNKVIFNGKEYDATVGVVDGRLTISFADTNGDAYSLGIDMNMSFFGSQLALILNINYADATAQDIADLILYEYESVYEEYFYGDFVANFPIPGAAETDVESLSGSADGIILGTNQIATYEYGYLVFASDTGTAYPALVFTIGDLTYYLAYDDMGNPVLYIPSTEPEAIDGFISVRYTLGEFKTAVENTFNDVWIGSTETLIVEPTAHTVNGVPYTIHRDPSSAYNAIMAFTLDSVKYQLTLDLLSGDIGILAKEIDGVFTEIDTLYSGFVYFSDLLGQAFMNYNQATFEYNVVTIGLENNQIILTINGTKYELSASIPEGEMGPVMTFAIAEEDGTSTEYVVVFDNFVQCLSIYGLETGFEAGHDYYMPQKAIVEYLTQFVNDWITPDGDFALTVNSDGKFVITIMDTNPVSLTFTPVVAFDENEDSTALLVYILGIVSGAEGKGVGAIFSYDDGSVIYEDASATLYFYIADQITSFEGTWTALDVGSAYTLELQEDFFVITGLGNEPLAIELLAISTLSNGVFYALGQQIVDLNVDADSNGTATIMQLQAFYIDNVVLVNLVQFEVTVVAGFIDQTLSSLVYLESVIFYNDFYVTFTGSYSFEDTNPNLEAGTVSIFTFEDGFAYYNGDSVYNYVLDIDSNGNLVVIFFVDLGYVTQDGKKVVFGYTATLSADENGDVTAVVEYEGVFYA